MSGAAYFKYYASGWAGGSCGLIKTVKFARIIAVVGFAAVPGAVIGGVIGGYFLFLSSYPI